MHLVTVISLPGGGRFGGINLLYNLLPRQHHCRREIWATVLDVAKVTGYTRLVLVA